jgi:hypothetical protein
LDSGWRSLSARSAPDYWSIRLRALWRFGGLEPAEAREASVGRVAKNFFGHNRPLGILELAIAATPVIPAKAGIQ